MSLITWLSGIFGDWNTPSLWSGGVSPGAADTASITAAGTYDVTLFGTASAAGVILNAAGATFYDAGALALGGSFNLQSGTLALAYGAIDGGTIALSGGVLAAGGGTLDGVAVQGALGLQAAGATLFVRDGLSLAGAGGSGAGSLALTGSGAALAFVGSQTLDAATVDFGAAGPGSASSLAVAHDGNATAGATLTLGPALWLRDLSGSGILTIGATTVGTATALPDRLISLGTITISGQSSAMTIAGSGTLTNRGGIAVANGATLTLACGGFANTGTVTVSSATLALGGDFAASRLANLGSVTLSNGTLSITGTAENAGGTLILGTGSTIGGAFGAISLAGTLRGGVIQDGGGGLSFAPGTGVLDGITDQGVLDLSQGGAVTLTDGASVSAPGGGGIASILDTGAGSALFLRGSEILDNATVALGNAVQAAILGTTDPFAAGIATTATLGAHLTVQQANLLASIDANGGSPFPGAGQEDTLVGEGLIAGAVTGGTLAISGFGTFINQGTIAISNGDTLMAAPGVFANTGTILVSSGATAVLGGPPPFFGAETPFWSNTGQIIVSGASLVLAGTTTTAQLGRISSTGGTITLAGTLANAGTTLTLGAAGLQNLSLSGTITGGSIADASGLLTEAAAGTGLLDGVTYAGTLAVTSPGALLRVRDGLSLNGTVLLTGAGADLAFWGSQGFGGGQLQIGAAGLAAAIDVQHDYTQPQGSTLTLTTPTTQTGALAAIGLPTDHAGDAIINAGAITAAVAGGTLTLGGNAFSNTGSIGVSNGETLAIATASFSNTGAISISGATLSIGGSLTLASLGSLTLTNAAIAVGGTLDLTGGTLSIGTGAAFGRIALSGTLRGGVIIDSGGGLAVTGNATLDGVTYHGLLDASRPFAQLAIADGLTLATAAGTQPGTLLVTGAAARVVATTTETFGNMVIDLGSAAAQYLGQRVPGAELAAGQGATLTLGARTTMNETGNIGVFGDASLGHWTDAVVNAGQIVNPIRAGTLVLGSSLFTNAGGITAGPDAVVQTANVNFTNTGTITLGQSSEFLVSLYDYFAAPNAGSSVFTNAGSILMQGALFQCVTANGLFPWVPFVNQAGASIKGNGIIAAPITNSGTVEASGGALSIYGPISGTGAWLIDPGAMLNPEGAASANVTVRYSSTGGTLILLQPSLFGGAIANYTTGDVIDLPALQLSVVAISNGTLVANTPTQVMRFHTTAAVGGELSVGRDRFGGSTIAITTQTFGGPAATIAVAQPSMLFWAAAAGDVFQGPTANLNGAHINNWLATDSLDLTNLSPTSASLTYTPGAGTGVLGISDGSHSAAITLFGTFTASAFQTASDGHGGTSITYHP